MDEDRKFRVTWMNKGGSLSISDRLDSSAAAAKLKKVSETNPLFSHLVMLSADSKFADEKWELVA